MYCGFGLQLKLDLEMAFRGEDNIMFVVERLLKSLWQNSRMGEYQHLAIPFPRMTYQTAMADFGSDKPDLRLGMKVTFS